MALSKEEKEQLDALTKKANEPDEPDFEIEIYDGPKGARLPYSRGRTYLQTHFGIDLDPDPAKESDGDQGTAAEGENGQGKKPAKRSQSPEQEGQQRTGHWSGRMDRHSA